MLLTLILKQWPIVQSEEIRAVHGLLSVRHLFELLLVASELLLNALFTERLILDHHDWLWEVHLAKVHLHGVCEEGLHWHLLLRRLVETFRFF